MSERQDTAAPPPAPARPGPVVKAGAPVFQAVIEIRRAATGAVERYTLTGTPVDPPEEH